MAPKMQRLEKHMSFHLFKDFYCDPFFPQNIQVMKTNTTLNRKFGFI